MATSRELPNFAEMDIEDIIDGLAEYKAAENFGKRMANLFKEALKAKLTDDELKLGCEKQGKKYFVTASPESQMRLNTEQLKEDFGKAWYKDYSKELEFVKFVTKVIPEEE